MAGLKAELDRCRREIDRLIDENTLLRRSSESFSALAQRLYEQLIEAAGNGNGRKAIQPAGEPVAGPPREGFP